MLQRFCTIPCLFVIGSLLVGEFALAQQSTEQAPVHQASTWIGGFGSLDDDRLSWTQALLELTSVDEVVTGKLKTDENHIYTVQMKTGDVGSKLVLTRRKDRLFSIEATDSVIVATADDDELPDKLMLRRIHPVSMESLDRLSGVYQFSDGKPICIRAFRAGLRMTDFTSGLVRILYAVSDDRFVAGPALAIPDPVETTFEFSTEGHGSVTRLKWIANDQTSRVAERRPIPKIESFVYDSFDGTKIAGSLYLPAGTEPLSGPFRTIVWVHGSGPAKRTEAGDWPWYFTNLGFAVLAVDKRGVGESEGQYNLPEGGSDNFPHMRRRSKDVAAAVAALRKRDDIQHDQIGLVGASQAGWVIPMTTVHTDIAFAVVLSGGATPLSIESKYSRLASENAGGALLKPVEQLIEELRLYQPSDTSIDEELSGMQFPCLWLYGYKDRSNPSQLCVERLTGLARQYNRDFTTKIFPDGNHGLLRCRFGGGAEFLTLSHLVPELHITIENWLDDKGLISHPK
jgi:pimeloyl-ACP methyl ester carboxylesterase